jgi:hypothetical protein
MGRQLDDPVIEIGIEIERNGSIGRFDSDIDFDIEWWRSVKPMLLG